jgi:hypothetical protein
MSRAGKAWQSIPPPGSAISLPSVVRLASGPDPGRGWSTVRDGTRILVHYSRSRVYLIRDAWEALVRHDDVFVQRVRYPGEAEYTIALTRAELEDVFGSVRATRSWEDPRCYHFPMEPPAVRSFIVDVGASDSLPQARKASGARPERAPPPAPPLVPAGPLRDWLDALENPGHRHVLGHIAVHGSLTEADAADLLGGAGEARRFAARLDGLLGPEAPLRVRVASVNGMKRYEREDA